MKAAVVVFPGSNCDTDAAWAWEVVTGEKASLVWHEERDLGGADAIILPGGFAYGDYLRAGALARLSPIMEAVRRAAEEGVPVLGICNGFQILCEAGLLPGALLPNESLTFRCQVVPVRVEDGETAWTQGLGKGEVLWLPIAHGEGRYVPGPDGGDAVRVVFRYAGPNPNGSVDAIAGVANQAGNVVGLMPHPERAAEALLGSTDGARLLRAVLRCG